MNKLSKRFVKDPDSRVPVTFDWSKYLPSGDQILSAVHIATPTLEVDDESITLLTTTAWIIGGVVGEVYELTSRITTLAGIIDDWTILVICQEK